ncbi:MAG: 3-deoxy-D-manno-octulosonic acid transferase [Flammeovirgaceae bacterium]|nr:3-deoxy-D-manno-octulosonic acid transferase [Flammeovirgaceae bacterium]
MKLLYDLSVHIYFALLRCISPFSDKAAAFLLGRKHSFWLEIPEKKPETNRYWFHVASLGEFEQCRPVIEALKKEQLSSEIVLTFFSPSGYEVQKNYVEADWIGYIPKDQYSLASHFVKQIDPDQAIFVKYEFWLNHLQACFDLQVPVVFFSVIFRTNHVYFGIARKLYKKYFRSVSQFFVQDQESAELLHGLGVRQVVIGGDTRFDRVITIAEQAQSLPLIERFLQQDKVWVMGSIWPADMNILLSFILNEASKGTQFILAPHNISAESIDYFQNCFPKSLRYSQISDRTDLKEARILILDTIGLLSNTYKYAKYAYIGGAFGAGLHNTIEATVCGIPVFFGRSSKNFKFKECQELMVAGAAFDFNNISDFMSNLELLNSDAANYQKAADAAFAYTRSRQGAAARIVAYLIKKV